MVEVGIAEAQSTFIALLQHVEQGEEVVIMREGSPIARLVPDALRPTRFTEAQRVEAQASVECIRERAKTLPQRSFNWEEVKTDRDFSRR